jgi:hypothetical protein
MKAVIIALICSLLSADRLYGLVSEFLTTVTEVPGSIPVATSRSEYQ